MQPIRPQTEGLKRVSLACNICRQRRIRCDGARPSCSSCLAKGSACEYQQGENKRKPPSKRYVESLQARIKVLEDQLASCGQAVLAAAVDDPHKSEDVADSDDSDRETSDAIYSHNTPGGSPSEETRETDFLREVTDTFGRMTVDDGGQLRYFGARSNYHLLQGFVRNHHDGQDLAASREDGMAVLSRLNRATSLPLNLQEHLLELYFRWQNPWVYIIEEDLFMRDFHSSDRTRYCTDLLLLAIFSVASRYSDRPELSLSDHPDRLGHSFAEEAKILLLYECETATITTVQAATLLSLHAMAENKEPAGWLFIGMATRMAYNLGLNLDCDKMLAAGLITDKDAELRKVVWWGCYTLDRLFCLGLGRFSTVQDREVTCPKPNLRVTAEFNPWVPSGDMDRAVLGVQSHIASCAQYQSDHLTIATKALDQLYAPNGKMSRSESESLVTTADVQLNVFWSTLPSFLRLPSSSRAPLLPHFYQLHLQYHVAQILLHRPLISRTRSSSKATRQVPQKGDVHLEACRSSASSIVKILQIYKYHYSLRLITVGAVCHTFTAAVIHLLDATGSDPDARQRGNEKLQICIAALHEMGAAWNWSYRACRALQVLAGTWLPSELRDSPPVDDDTIAPDTASPNPTRRIETPALPTEGISPSASQFEDWFNFPDLPKSVGDDLGWLVDDSNTYGYDVTGLFLDDWQDLGLTSS